MDSFPPPILVIPYKWSYKIVDGHHRVEAQRIKWKTAIDLIKDFKEYNNTLFNKVKFIWFSSILNASHWIAKLTNWLYTKKNKWDPNNIILRRIIISIIINKTLNK